MDAERFRRIEAIYREVEGRSLSERSRVLDAQCAGDDGLRAEVERLLGAAPTMAGLAETAADLAEAAGRRFDSAARAAEAEEVRIGAGASNVPERIGPYRILSVLGRGGMGMVLEGERDAPKQRVAIKVIAPGMADESMLRRFELEAQVLASLRYPGIAVLHDAGRLGPEHGEAPWFAMEFVPGAKPLTAYCDEADLDLDARIVLFRRICAAVEHGHRKGFLHRDLKPDNILVDEEGNPKIIDFGLARGVADLKPAAGATVPGQLLGTPSYMSPEQAGGDPDAVDARTDVYAMGVVLYELLTGRLPYVLAGPLPVILRTITETAPEPASRWDRRLRGDGEIILQTALAKSPDDRYGSISAFADDLARWREGRPISVRRDSIVYVATRELFRRKVPVAIGVVVVVLAVGAGSFFLSARTAEAKRDELDRVRSLLMKAEEVENPFEQVAPTQEEVDYVERWLESAGVDTDAEAEMRVLLGRGCIKRGQFGRAEGHLARAVEIRRAAGSEARGDAEALAEALHQRGRALLFLSRFADAEASYLEAIALRRRLFGDRHESVADSLNDLAACRKRQGAFAEAEPLYREALEIRRSLLGDDDPWTLASRNNLGTCVRDVGRYAEALPLFVQATDTLEAQGWNPQFVLRGRRNEATCLIELGRLDEARTLIDEIETRTREALGGSHPDLAALGELRARLALVAGRPQDAVAEARTTLAAHEARFGRPHARIAATEQLLVEALLAAGEPDAASVRLLRLRRDAEELYGDDHPVSAALLVLGVEAMLDGGEVSIGDAADALAQARGVLERTLAPAHPDRRRLERVAGRMSA